MGEKKVTRMLLKVDLQCSKCYKKVKKVLCQFSHVRDQTFDEKANTVTIKVVCCSPEKIKDKIRYKGGASINSIEIIPDKPKEEERKKPELKKPEEKKPEEKKPLKQPPHQEINSSDGTKETKGEPPSPKKLKEPKNPPVQPIVLPGPAPGYSRTCYTECYEGHGGGPYNQLCYGKPVRYYDGYCGRPIYDSWGGGGGYRPCYATWSGGESFSNENPSACSIM